MDQKVTVHSHLSCFVSLCKDASIFYVFLCVSDCTVSCFLIPTDHKIQSKWINIRSISLKMREPHIMELLKLASVELDHPSKLVVSRPGSRATHQFSRLKLKSVGDAKKFVKKFNGFEMEQNKGQKLVVEMVKVNEHVLDKKLAKFQTSEWLKMTNLNHDLSVKGLAKYIQEETKLTPKSVDLRRHSESDQPSFALVQMMNLKDAKAVIKKLQMTSLKGQKMWIQQCRGVNNERNEDSKGMDKEVIVRNLPLDIHEKTLRKLCA